MKYWLLFHFEESHHLFVFLINIYFYVSSHQMWSILLNHPSWQYAIQPLWFYDQMYLFWFFFIFQMTQNVVEFQRLSSHFLALKIFTLTSKPLHLCLSICADFRISKHSAYPITLCWKVCREHWDICQILNVCFTLFR